VRARWAPFVAGLFLVALTLRPQLVGISPLIPRIQSSLHVSHAVAGLLGTVPVLCMGLFAPPAPYLSARIGSRAAVALAVALIAVFGIARTLTSNAVLVILLTFPVGIGIGLAGALLPVAVKERFPHRPAFVTGIYAAGIYLGSAISSAVAVPLANVVGGWRGPLVVFSVLTAVLGAGWLVFTRGGPPHARDAVPPIRLPWRSSVAWQLVAIFFLMSTVFYGLNAWLPDAYQEHGWSEGSAGALLAVSQLAGLPMIVLVPWLADRSGSRRLYLVGLSSLAVLGTLGLVLVPGGAWAWAAISGGSVSVLFALVLTLPLDVSRDPGEVGAVAGMMLGVGYLLASASPFALGAIRDATGSFTATLWVIVGSAVGLVAMCAAMSGERLRRGVETSASAPAR
jgi:MFS transporter, CP family, cyanate transporter